MALFAGEGIWLLSVAMGMAWAPLAWILSSALAAPIASSQAKGRD